MSSRSRFQEGLTLEEFLRTPGIDEPPYQEYIDGRIPVSEVFGWLKSRLRPGANSA